MGLLARTLGSAGVDAISTRARSINFATRIADVSSTLMFLNDLRLGQAAEATNLGGGQAAANARIPRNTTERVCNSSINANFRFYGV